MAKKVPVKVLGIGDQIDPKWWRLLHSFRINSEPSEVHYSPNQYLDRDFFCHFLQQNSSRECTLKVLASCVVDFLLFSKWVWSVNEQFHLSSCVWIMAKLKNPPQGGEKYLCITLFLTMILSVVSTVAIIYSVVIIYLPSKEVLESKMMGPVMCTTLSNERNINDATSCGGGKLV